ncbi:aminodeoxychorismate lyase [Martelella alba]|uniref:Probable branched-chain-amino-acid aminotransferase n=1 Tax=Martelella alba TaxID=2590451 RepID=A0ABY2SNY9_9HYPH|nr:aminodeoxychorismate lyase [Martelella alba]TKI07703.1 aminodeoxychorismate lyase [Martelella alba]
MYWINGQPRRHLSLTDRAIHYGDGFFTTARIRDGGIDLLPYHLDRLTQAGERLLFPAIDRAELEREMRIVAEHAGEGVLKVIISRGAGGRGYGREGVSAPIRIMSLGAMPAHYPSWRDRGVCLCLSPVRLACSPLLAGIKHLNRLEQVLVRAHLSQTAQADDAVVLDARGYVTECSAANIFWRRGRDVYTPTLSQAGVAGVMRRHIMAMLADSAFTLRQTDALPAVLAEADELVLCNALMPVLPASRFADRSYTERTLFDFLKPNC